MWFRAGVLGHVNDSTPLVIPFWSAGARELAPEPKPCWAWTALRWPLSLQLQTLASEVGKTNSTNIKKLEPAPIIYFRVGGSFSQNPETTFLLGPGGMHVEHHAVSAPRCRGASDQRCVEMTTWGGSPTCTLHLHLMDRLSNGTPPHGTLRRRAQFLPLK